MKTLSAERISQPSYRPSNHWFPTGRIRPGMWQEFMAIVDQLAAEGPPSHHACQEGIKIVAVDDCLLVEAFGHDASPESGRRDDHVPKKLIGIQTPRCVRPYRAACRSVS